MNRVTADEMRAVAQSRVMSIDFLFDDFDRLIQSPESVHRLRRFILDLAVRGKLAPQDPNDDPASELLKRIASEKARLVKAGEIKKQKRVARFEEAEPTFELPSGWFPTKLALVAVCLDYMRKPVNGTERKRRIAGKSRSQLFPYFGATQQQGWIDEYIFDEELVLLGEDGVPFFDSLRPKAYLISGKSWVNNHAHVFRGILVSNAYLVHYLNVFDYSGRVVGATRSKLNQANAVDIPVMLPPVAEQHRIVAKVDELMALCDRLEAARAEREATRDRLATASLSGLNAPDPEPTIFQRDVAFALNNLTPLTTHPDQIKALRQTILNLAVRGKLVEQDLEDEAVIKQHSGKPKCEGLPANWRRLRLEEFLSENTRNGYSRKPDDAHDGIPMLRISAGTTRIDGLVAEEEHKLISGVGPDIRAKYSLKSGDLLACRFNGNKKFVGRMKFFKDYLGIQPIYPDKLIRVRVDACKALPEFVRIAAESDRVRQQVENFCSTTVGNWGISASNLRKMLFSLPPRAEQRLIVAKVDELMFLCDQLEKSLVTGDDTCWRLLNARLHKALKPNGSRRELAC